ncbi:Asp-tRNA(Asn)/Glu-tRNA(Gln) amidotransferase subunit GatA [bacterium]|nr:Asp-tRNA(Asn)/Glu-tRNA(Gln) amidotransferase subunit GatA [bacterium]
MSELVSLTAAAMREGIISGKFSAVELTKAHLEQIKKTNETYNSFLTICEEQALAEAQAVDARIAKDKKNVPLLAGVPVAVKDMLITKGIETTAASKVLKGFVPPYESTVVERLRNSGAVIIGKTNLDEFAMGASNERSAFGPVKNPYDLTRVPGGSSGGSVVAVATGQAPLSLGTDTGGSIRQPAALTGVIGLKPTYGRVSRYGAIAFASSLDQIGPMARSVEDIGRILQVISGHDEKDSTSMEVDVPDFVNELSLNNTTNLAGLRIGVPREYFIDGIQEDTRKAVEEGIALLAKLGAEIKEISLPHSSYGVSVYYIIGPAEASSNLARYDGIRYGYRSEGATSLTDVYEMSRGESFGAEVRRRILVGSYVLSAGYYDAYYRKAQQVRTLICNDFKAAFANDCDLIATPTSPSTAFKIGEKMSDPIAMYLADVLTIPTNLAGLPGISLPCKHDSQGLPIGFQLIGPAFSESLMLRVSQAFMKEVGYDTTQKIAR